MDTHAPRERAFDSTVDLFDQTGRPVGMPDIELPNGVQGDVVIPRFRASVCEAVDRISVYLFATASPRHLANGPNSMLLELWTGMSCMEEFATSSLIFPTTYDAGGMLFTWWSPVLFTSIVFTGLTINGAPTEAPQSVGLRVYLDRAGMCCPDAPRKGPLTVEPQ
jgi:hypothetical protein